MTLTRKLAIILICSLACVERAVAEYPIDSCGKAQVSFFNSSIKESPFFVLKVLTPRGLDAYYPYEVDRDIFELRCETKSDGMQVILFNYLCRGSGCAESNYGIIDSMTGKLLIEPGDRFRGNDDRASQIVGHPIKPFACEKYSTESLGVMSPESEYCFRSPLELD
jgi:hypothetical protein